MLSHRTDLSVSLNQQIRDINCVFLRLIEVVVRPPRVYRGDLEALINLK